MAQAIEAALTGDGARRALIAFRGIAAEDRDASSFIPHALDRLAELVGSDLTTLSLCDLERQSRKVVSRRGEAVSDAERAIFDHHFRDHPLVCYHSTHPAGATQRISDCLSVHDFRQSAVFADYYRRIGIDHVMALPLRIDAANVVSVVFNRRGTDFADRERALVDVLRQPLATLYRGIVAREEAQRAHAALEGLVARAGWHRARVTADGRLAGMAAETARMLERYVGDRVPPESVAPSVLEAWLRRRRRNWGLDWWRAESIGPLVLRAGGGRLTIHFIADPLVPERGELLMLEEVECVTAAALHSLPLTEREREVLALVAAGKTNANVGAILAISPRTVQKHLERVFEKLGVETRTAAAVRAAAAARTDRQSR